jgi:RNA polymerase sigma-70 factor (ECF subfamily)
VSGPEADDNALVRRCNAGDRQAFESLLNRYERGVFNAVLRMVGNFDDACDTTQEVFVKAFQNLRSFDPRHRFFSWIYRIAINESLNLVSKRSRRRTATGFLIEPVDPTDGHRAAAAGRDLYEALARLRPDQRSVIVLKHILGCSYRDIAEILRIPESTVKSRLFAAREDLRAILLDDPGRHES